MLDETTPVSVTCRGVAVAGELRIASRSDAEAFIEMAEPLPVGTTVAVTVGDEAAFEARVMHVREQIAGREEPAGMRVKTITAEERAEAERRAAEKKAEAAEKNAGEPEEVAASPQSESEQSQDSGSTAERSSAEPSSAEPSSAQPAKGKRKRRRRRRTTRSG